MWHTYCLYQFCFFNFWCYVGVDFGMVVLERERKMKVILPLPPSMNQTYKAVYSSRLKRVVFYMTYKAKKWKKEAQKKITQKRPFRGDDEVDFYCVACTPTKIRKMLKLKYLPEDK